MKRIDVLLHKMAAQNCKLVSGALIEMTPVFKDMPRVARNFTDLAAFALRGNNSILELLTEVERLTALERSHRQTMLQIAEGLETHSKDVCWIGPCTTATEAILHQLDPECAKGDYPDCIANLRTAFDAEVAALELEAN